MEFHPEWFAIDLSNRQTSFREAAKQSNQIVDDFSQIKSFNRTVVFPQQTEKLVHETGRTIDGARQMITDIGFAAAMGKQTCVTGGGQYVVELVLCIPCQADGKVGARI